MRVDQFDFELPEELIAQTPLKNRDMSRLMVLNKKTGEIKHEVFHQIIDYLKPNDTLVLNNTKVMPARLMGQKQDTGAHIEVLLLKQEQDDCWETLVKPAKRVKVGTVVEFGDGRLKAECIQTGEMGKRIFKFVYEGIFYEVLDSLGEMPLPPYITEKLDDRDRYQTVFAKEIGSAAAPTAGLHFTTELLEKIKSKGVNIAYVTLHVGLGTFRPVSATSVEEHEMHAEFYQIGEKEAEKRIPNLVKRGVVMRGSANCLGDLFRERVPLYERYADVIVRCDGKTVEETVAAIAAAAGYSV